VTGETGQQMPEENAGMTRAQQTGGLLNIQVRWINPDGVVTRTSDLPMDQSQEGALWTWQVDRLEKRDLAQAGVWVVELLISGHRVGRYPLLVRA